MFVAVVQFPPIKPGKDAEFQAWFASSNRELARSPGFIGRRLLRRRSGGNYAAIIEYASYETFVAIQSSPVHLEAHRLAAQLLDGDPKPTFYDVVVG